MGSQSGADTTPSGQDQLADPQEPEQRSFFGRILDALTPGDSGRDNPNSSKQDSPQGGAQGPAPLHGLANLRKLRVDDVAIPKVDIIAVPLDATKEELVEAFRKHGFSRMPIYKDSLDHPQGLILLKDLALQFGFGAGGRFSLRKMLRPILYAPPSMPVGVLLQKMQRERVHMALVIDEYGGVDGLVTIEDLIETVIGEIDDEHDEAETALWREEKPGVWVIQSTAALDEVETLIGQKLRRDEDDDEIDTLGGLIFLRAGRVPARGEIVAHESGVEFEVIDADARRLKRVRLRLPVPVEG
jgi:magnesium and cobalt transporter